MAAKENETATEANATVPEVAPAPKTKKAAKVAPEAAEDRGRKVVRFGVTMWIKD